LSIVQSPHPARSGFDFTHLSYIAKSRTTDMQQTFATATPSAL
jgi:hypothetical protein